MTQMDERTATEDAEDAGTPVEEQPVLCVRLVHPDSPGVQAIVTPARRAPLLVGRQSGEGRLCARDVKLSRTHFQIVWDRRSRTYRIEDLGSRNGTYLNGRRLRGATLGHADVIRAGDSLFVCELSAQGGAERDRMVRAARSTIPILITGETGTGKDRLARRLHALSGRDPFIPLNCGAIPRDLAATELFGHTRGAFSGAGAARSGVFLAASGGTLFLDEIGDLPLDLQPALLRALDEGSIRPIGTERERRVDVRVIAATNADLKRAMDAGRFRRDLYARLTGLTLDVAPLRDRRHDILTMARHIATEERTELRLSADAAEALLLWDWPYNVRELKAVLRAHWALAQAPERLSMVDLGAVRREIAERLSERRANPDHPSPLAAEPRAELERLTRQLRPKLSPEAVVQALDEAAGNASQAAQSLGVCRATLYRSFKDYSIDPKDFRRWPAQKGAPPTADSLNGNEALEAGDSAATTHCS